MLGQPDYTIRARIVAEDFTDAGTDTAGRKLDGVERRARSAGRSITRYLGRAFMLLGGAYGIGRLTRGMLGFNVQIQEAQFGLATLFNARAGMEMTSSLRLARTEINALRKDAARGVGEFEHYRQAYQMTLAPITTAGGTLADVRRLTRQALAAGFAMEGQHGMGIIPLDLVQALTVGAGERTTRTLSNILRSAGQSIEQFNAAPIAKRMELLTEAFGKFAPGVELMGSGWTAQMDTLKDQLRFIGLTATEPLFERWTEHLRGVNRWLEKNADRIQQLAEHWGVKLLRVWEHLVDHAATYAAIVAGAGLGRVAFTGGMAVGGFVRRRGGLKAAGGSLLGGLLGGGSLLGGGAGGGLASVLLPLTVTLAAAAAVAGGVVGALKELPRAGGWVMEQLGELTGGLGMLGHAFMNLFEHSSLFNKAGLGAIGVFGKLLEALNAVVPLVAAIARAMVMWFNMLGDAMGLIAATIRGDRRAATQNAALLRARYGLYMADATGYLYGKPPKPKLPGEGEDGELGDTPWGGGNTIINGDVNVDVKAEVNADPTRVAVAWNEILDGIERNRRQPRRRGLVPVPG